MIGLLTVFQVIRAFIRFTEVDKLALKPIHLCFMVCDKTICYIIENAKNYHHRWASFLHICGDIERNPGPRIQGRVDTERTPSQGPRVQTPSYSVAQ